MKKKKRLENIEKDRWDEEEIKKAARIIVESEKKKHSLVKALDEIVHWLILLLVIFGNIIIAGFMIIISGITNGLVFYSVLVLIALGFGLLIEIPLIDIEKIDRGKHFLSRLMLPLLALANVYLFIGIKNSIEFFTLLDFSINALLAGIVYGIVFLMPHYINHFLRKMG